MKNKQTVLHLNETQNEIPPDMLSLRSLNINKKEIKTDYTMSRKHSRD